MHGTGSTPELYQNSLTVARTVIHPLDLCFFRGDLPVLAMYGPLCRTTSHFATRQYDRLGWQEPLVVLYLDRCTVLDLRELPGRTLTAGKPDG